LRSFYRVENGDRGHSNVLFYIHLATGFTSYLTFESAQHHMQRQTFGLDPPGNLSSGDGSKEGMVSTYSIVADTARRHVIRMHIRSTTLQSGMTVPHCMALFPGSRWSSNAVAFLRFSSLSLMPTSHCFIDGREWITAGRNSKNSISFPQSSGLSMGDRFGVESIIFDTFTSCRGIISQPSSAFRALGCCNEALPSLPGLLF
jgi:hypothetical protein